MSSENNTGSGRGVGMFPHAPAVMYGAAPFEPILPIDPLNPFPNPLQPWPASSPTTAPVQVQAPPPYAADAELDVIGRLGALDDVTRARVLRYAISRWMPEETK